MSYKGRRPTVKKSFKSPRISSKRYSINTDPPMHASAFKTTVLPTKVELAKMDYELALEQSSQTKLVQQINTLDKEMKNERARYQNTNRKMVKGEAELVTGSRLYTTLKRQKETLQREQQSSLDRITNLSAKKSVTASPVQRATKSFRGIGRKNPMISSRSYVPVVPASSGPLSGITSILSKPLIPQASAFPTPVTPIAKAATKIGEQFAKGKSRGDLKMLTKVINDEKRLAKKNATPEQIQAKVEELKENYPDLTDLHTKSMAKEVIGDEAGEKIYKQIQQEGIWFRDKKVDFTKGTKGTELAQNEQRLTEMTAMRDVIASKGKKTLKVQPGRRGAGKTFSKKTAEKMVATGAIASTSALPAAYGATGPATSGVYEVQPTFDTKSESPNIISDFITGVKNVGHDYSLIANPLMYDEDISNDPKEKAAVSFGLTAAIDQLAMYGWDREEFDKHSQAKTLPFDLAVQRASNKPLATLAGEFAVEAAMWATPAVAIRGVMGVTKGAKIVRMAQHYGTKAKAAKAGGNVYFTTAKGLKEAKKIKAGGYRYALKVATKETASKTARDPFGIWEGAGGITRRIGARIPGKVGKGVVKISAMGNPIVKGTGYRLPDTARVFPRQIFGGKGAKAMVKTQTYKPQRTITSKPKPIPKVKPIPKARSKPKARRKTKPRSNQRGLVDSYVDFFQRGGKKVSSTRVGKLARRNPKTTIALGGASAFYGYSSSSLNPLKKKRSGK